MLNTIITGSEITAVSFFICTAVSLLLGVLSAMLSMYGSKPTQSFVITLAVIPAIVQVIIMLVNGNIGTGLAIAGAFSLVRFRSASASGKEISLIFLAMAIGLAAGMGYVALAVIFFAIVALFICLLQKVRFGAGNENLRSLKITISENLDYDGLFDDIFAEYGGFNHGLPTTIYYYGCEEGRELITPEMVFAWQTLTDAVWWSYGLSARHLEAEDAPTKVWEMYDRFQFTKRKFIPYWAKEAAVSSDRDSARASVWFRADDAVQVLGVANIAPHPGKAGDTATFRIPREWGRPVEVRNLLHPAETCAIQGNEITVPWHKTWNSAFLAVTFAPWQP